MHRLMLKKDNLQRLTLFVLNDVGMSTNDEQTLETAVLPANNRTQQPPHRDHYYIYVLLLLLLLDGVR